MTHIIADGFTPPLLLCTEPLASETLHSNRGFARRMAAASLTMANGSGPDPFAEHNLLEAAIRGLTVNSLKQLIKDINNSSVGSRGYLKISGNKPELASRVINTLTERKTARDVAGFALLKSFISKNGGYLGSKASVSMHSTGSTGYPGSGQTLGSIPASKLTSNPSSSMHSVPVNSAPISGIQSRSLGASVGKINFRPSPFYEIKEFLTTLQFCPEAPTAADRKVGTVHVMLKPEHITMLKQPEPPCEARLFCTTADSYGASLSGRNPAPVEFPQTCEARVNGVQLSTNLRGSKKTTGRVPPPNINKDKALVLIPGRPNRIELNYTNAQKRHVMAVALCQVTRADTLVQRLRQRQFRSKESVLNSMKRAAEDDDIQAGAATMSLKCPLSYMRMVTPCRSSQCPHVQCFDALSFYSVNEQTPSWSCPVCNRIIKPDELMMDGYVDDILKKVPEEHDAVIVEPDGSWRTQDGQVTSEGAQESQPSKARAFSQALGFDDEEDEDMKDAETQPEAGARASGAGSPVDVVILDSPTPPSGPTPAARTPVASAVPAGPSSASRTAETSRQSSTRPAAEPEIIDLTLDSDDEDQPPVPPSAVKQNGSVAPPASRPMQNGPVQPRPSASGPPDGDSTPEEEQVRRPGKRTRTDEAGEAAGNSGSGASTRASNNGSFAPPRNGWRENENHHQDEENDSQTYRAAYFEEEDWW